MLHGTSNGGEQSASPVALILKGQIEVALYRLEHALEYLTDADQQDLTDELAPIVRCARSRAESRQIWRVGVPLVASITV